MKLAAKRFAPSLLNIPEEEHYFAHDKKNSIIAVSRQGSTISLKRENSRKRTCTGCPGCENNNLGSLTPQLTEIPALFKCYSCVSTTTESKQKSIRKWLDNLPVPKDETDSIPQDPFLKSSIGPKKVRAPSPLSPSRIVPPTIRSSSLSPNSDKFSMNSAFIDPKYVDKNVNIVSSFTEENIYETVATLDNVKDIPKSASKMTNDYIQPQTLDKKVDTLTKKQMNAVINELTMHSNVIIPPTNQSTDLNTNSHLEYDTDSLERKKTGGK